MFDWLPPAMILLVGAALIGLVRGQLRALVILIAPLLTLWAWLLYPSDADDEPLRGDRTGT